jgi:DedD protein
MGLLSIFQRNKQASAQPVKGRGGRSAARQTPLANTQNPVDTAEAVREARARARTRLMGATVLLLVGVIGFPLLFETQPRPIPVDLPIEIPARNAPGAADAGAHARTPAARPAVASVPALAASVPRPESVTYDARPSAPAAASEPASTPARRSAFASLAAAFTSSASASSPASSSSTVAQARPAARPEKHAAPASAPDSRPAPPLAVVLPPPPATPSPAAILAGTPTPTPKPSDAAAAGRFVVQVGAFLDEAKVHETRGKVEKLGMKTYTQPVDTPTGKRIRVRVGPYATKAEADKVATRLKGDGLQAVVLAL